MLALLLCCWPGSLRSCEINDYTYVCTLYLYLCTYVCTADNGIRVDLSSPESGKRKQQLNAKRHDGQVDRRDGRRSYASFRLCRGEKAELLVSLKDPS